MCVLVEMSVEEASFLGTIIPSSRPVSFVEFGVWCIACLGARSFLLSCPHWVYSDG